MSSYSRVYYMDNLRAFAMLLGVFFHAALAYGPSLQEVWLPASTDNAAYMDFFAFFSHAWRMPLFFIIAGFFAALLHKKRGLAALTKNRLLRVTLPFIVFLPLVIISMVMIIGWAISNVENMSPMLGIVAFMSQNPDAPPPPASTTHLWFLYQLTFFYAVTIGYLALSKKFKRLHFSGLSFAIAKPMLFLLLAPLLLVPALLTQHAPIPAPEQFIPQLWSFAYFGMFFVFGWALFSKITLLDRLQPYLFFTLLVSVVCYTIFYILIPKSLNMQEAMTMMSAPPAIDKNQIILSLLQAFIAVHMSIAALLIGRRYFNKQSSIVRIISDSSYWIYIVHLPLLWCIQFVLLDYDWPMLVEFFVSTFSTIIIGFVSYLIFVRWTPVGWLLNGKK